jgi:hypothetical protein
MARADEWEVISRARGVIVSLRREPDREFPTFRGVGTIDVGMWDIFALLEDMESHTRWMHRCSRARIVGEESKHVRYLYNRTDAPWPVADRDVVVRSAFSMSGDGKDIWTKFRSIEGKFVHLPGVVRMPFLEGFYHLSAQGEGKTVVEYQVNADPGGTLPTWVVNQISKDMPERTIIDLREESKRTQGTYDIAALKRAIGVED